MKLFNLLRRTVQRVRRDGLRETAGLIRKNIVFAARARIHRNFDRKYGVDTSRRIELDELSVDSENKKYGVYYEPTPEKTLRAILAHLPADLSEFVFIDFGSGKGRTMAVASNLNFKRIIGVEFADELHEIAERNFRDFKHEGQRCFRIDTVHGDATAFELPDEKSVYYFFNPFLPPIFEKVLGNIVESHRAHPRKVYLQYYNPNETVLGMLEGVEFLRRMETRPLPYDFAAPMRRKLVMYESVGAS